MTTDACLENTICLRIKDYKDACNVYTFEDEYSKILKLTTLSVKTFSNALSKDSIYLEINEIDRIKNALLTHHNKSAELEAFKEELMKDLSEFQGQIETKHNKQILDYRKQMQVYETEIKNITNEKNKITLEKLLSVAWLQGSKTKEFENKIALLRAKIEKCSKLIKELESSTPTANEKDVLMYQIHLKDKYKRPNKE